MPDGWMDKSVIILSAPPRADRAFPPSFVVTRCALNEGETVEAYADRALYECAQQFDGFELIERPHVRIANRTARSILYRWQSPRGSVTQHQVYVGGKDGTVLCLTASALTTLYERERALFEEVFDSVRLPG
jgi:hypothetical protein